MTCGKSGEGPAGTGVGQGGTRGDLGGLTRAGPTSSAATSGWVDTRPFLLSDRLSSAVFPITGTVPADGGWSLGGPAKKSFPCLYVNMTSVTILPGLPGRHPPALGPRQPGRGCNENDFSGFRILPAFS